MREAPSGYIEPPPSPHPPKSNLPMLYYGFAVVSTTVIVLALYNLIIIKCCMRRQTQQGQRPNGLVEATTAANQSFENTNRNFLSIFNYKKDMNITEGRGQEQEQGCEYECPVCLSVFEEGEEVRQLPRCKHSFHAPCIDMWLYTHFDCPLCRAPVDVSRYDRHMHMNSSLDSPEHSREILFGGSSTS